MNKQIKHISFGENCLVDFLFNRYKIKEESYVFGSVRTNVEYNIEILKDNFNDLLNLDFLKKEVVNKTQNVIKNIKYKNIEKIYSPAVSSFFEFTHHNVIDNNEDIESFNRKIIRTKELLDNNDIIFWYNYRAHQNNNLDTLIEIFQNLISYLNLTYNNKYKVCILVQILTYNKNKFEHIDKDNINIIKF